MTSELRRYLVDEFQRLGPELAAMERAIRAFWEHPETPALGVWGVPPVVTPPPVPPADGAATERYLYGQLHGHIHPAIEAHRMGFLTVPTLLPHLAYYPGAFPQSHLVATSLGATVTDTGNPLAVGTEPLIRDLTELPRIAEADVAQSPLLRALCRAIEEMMEITQGALAVEPYVQHGALDFAADVIGVQAFYELTALDQEGAARLLQVCARKWVEYRRAQEQAAGGRWACRRFEPGLYYGDSLLENLPPLTIRELALPVAGQLASEYGGIVFGIARHGDESLMADIAALPKFRGCVAPFTWPTDAVIAGMAGKGTLRMDYAGYLFAPDWRDCLAHVRRLAGKVRLLSHICPMHCRCNFKETNRQLRDAMMRQFDDLRSTWATQRV